MTTSTTTTATLVTEPTVTDTKSKELTDFDIAVAKIMKETGCSKEDAITGIEFIRRMANKARTGARCGTQGTHHLTYAEMDELGYAVMDSIMEHNATAAPDSAHAAVQKLVLGSEEYALTHNNPTGQRHDCTVTFDVGFVS